jgi:hypothetical protein
MHLHDRHAAHLTLHGVLKQAGESLGARMERSRNGRIFLQFPGDGSFMGLMGGFRKVFVTGRNDGFPFWKWRSLS